MTRSRTILTTGLLLGLTALGEAQVAPRQYQVGARFGSIKYDESSGIKRGPVIGVDGTYFLSRNVGVGFLLDVSRPQTRGEWFPAEFRFGDTLLLSAVTQPLTIVQVGVHLLGTVSVGPLSPYASVGGGWYRYYLDPQVAAAPETFTHPMFTYGAGVSLRLGARSSVRFDVRDYVQTDFDRDRLNPVDTRFRPVRFPNLFPTPPAEKSTIHNLQLAVAFSLVPGGQ